MTDLPETIEKFQKTLNPFIKPREQVNYIRRILALHLGSSSHDGPIHQPASLANATHEVTLSPELRGVQREYVAALKANLDARRKYEEAVKVNEDKASSSPEPANPKPDVLGDRIALLKLQDKQRRLAVVREYLDNLAQKPASSPGFLQVDQIFDGVPNLPNVPKEVLNSLVAENSGTKPDLKKQVAQLEKTVLRTKLLQRKEEQLLQESKTRSQAIPDVLSNGTRLQALTSTRTELINWIETELSKASGGEEGGEDSISSAQHRDKMEADKTAVNDQLEAVKEKYVKYLDSRKHLLQEVSQRRDPSRPPILKPLETTNVSEESPRPSNYLLTLYIEALLAIQRKQKGMIAQKSHVNSTLGRQSKDAGQIIGHLADESQLLPQYPMKGAARRKSGFGDEMVLTASERGGLSGKMQPWVFAADSAKISTLETVAEKVESGQVALEESTKTLEDIDRLLGFDQDKHHEETGEEMTEDDVWLDAGPQTPGRYRKHTEKKQDKKKPKDVWSNLHGNLGLLGPEDSV